MKKTYIGDGVYAELTQGGDIILRTGEEGFDGQQIVLEPQVWDALVAFLGRAIAKQKETST